MSSFNLKELGDQLKDVTRNNAGPGVSFANRSLKLDTEEDALEIVKAIRECKNLEYLDLEGNTLGPLAAKVVAQALQENGSLLQRALWKDMFTGRLKSEIPKALEYLGNALCSANTHLVELDLSDNAFGPIGIQGLVTFLKSSSCYTLHVLRLNNNGLGISGGKMLAKALLDCYDNSSNAGTSPLALKVFVAGRNRLENEGAKALASVFQKLTSLEEVAMPQNGIYHQGITALANGLSFNHGLRILNLNDNTIGPKGAQAIAKVLPNFKNLEQLNLGDCLLKTEGGLVLAEALGVEGSYPLLTELNLSYNEIHTKGASPIADAMADKEHLVTLQLDGNSFGKEGRAILRESLKGFEKIGPFCTLNEDNSDDESDEEGEEEDEEEEKDEEEEEEGEEEEEEEGEEEEEEEENKEETGEESEDDGTKKKVENKENGDNNRDTITNGNIKLSKVSVTEFLKSPTGEKLLLLQDNAEQEFVEYAKNISKNADTSSELKFIEEFTRIIMKVSALSTNGYADVKLKAQYLTDALYSKLCSLAVENNQTSVLNNALLVNLGLIKAEDKNSGKIDWNLEGCFRALEIVTQKDFFLQETRNTLKLFLEKPVKTSKARFVDSSQESKDSLKAILNRIPST